MVATNYSKLSDTLYLFKHAAKKGDIWQARIKLQKQQGNRRYKWVSLGTTKLKEAKEKAVRAEADVYVKQQHGIAVVRKRIQDVIDEYLAELEQGAKRVDANNNPQVSLNVLRQYKRTLRYWREYLWNREIESVSDVDFEKYAAWRSKYWKNQEKRHGNAKDVPSKRTLQWEVNSMKACLKWAKGRKLYSGEITYRLKTEKKEKKHKRATFSVEDYTKLHRYMRTNAWLKDGGRHGTDKRLLRYREMLRHYVLILANTGMRVGEARELRWCDIRFQKDKQGRDYVVFDVKRGKQGRHEYLGRASCKRFLERLRGSRDDNIADDDYLWCDVDGRVIRHFREGFNKLIQQTDVEKDSNGDKRTIYSLRHFFISMMLRKGVDIFHVARMCNTSVQMINDTYGHVSDEQKVNLINVAYR